MLERACGVSPELMLGTMLIWEGGREGGREREGKQTDRLIEKEREAETRRARRNQKPRFMQTPGYLSTKGSRVLLVTSKLDSGLLAFVLALNLQKPKHMCVSPLHELAKSRMSGLLGWASVGRPPWVGLPTAVRLSLPPVSYCQ